MLKEVMDYLEPAPGKFFVDGTLGGGGYTFALADKIGNTGKVYSFDLDDAAVKNAEEKISKEKIKNVEIINDNFKNLQRVFEKVPAKEFGGFDGIVFDLGLSSNQLQDEHRGFSFQLDAPLNMSFGNTENGISTKNIINKYSQAEIERILKEYGEESWAKKIAGSIVRTRKTKEISTTNELVEIIKKSIPARAYTNKKIHVATKTFQALRIATNRELDNIATALPLAVSLLKNGGRLAVVSFHSLEDRIVKKFMREESHDCICAPQVPVCVCNHKASLRVLSKKAIKPGQDELIHNPKSRSAILRIAEKI
jgi:16S rRNA (cytosine1402-N4)-methyltransferase